MQNTEDFAAHKLIIHPIDQQVKPIVGNKLIEVISAVPYHPEKLPFDPLPGDNHECLILMKCNQ